MPSLHFTLDSHHFSATIYYHCMQLQVVNASSQMMLFQRAQYCPAPPGDSITRKSLFDSLVAGCVPVLFAKASLRQYMWFFTEKEVRYCNIAYLNFKSTFLLV